LTVPSVAITAMRRLRVAATPARAPGSITPITWIGAHASCSRYSATAEAVLQAITSIFTPWSCSRRVAWSA
jgi:hypothetical protein